MLCSSSRSSLHSSSPLRSSSSHCSSSSWQGNRFSLGRQIHNRESTHFVKQLQILLTDRLAYTGLTVIPVMLFFLRRHYLECMQGWLGKHFEKLVQCDARLNLLSQQTEITLGYPYFESWISSFEDTNVRDREFDLNNEGSLNFIDLTSPFGAQCSSKTKQDPRPLTYIHQEKQSPRSVNYVFYLISALKLS